MTAPKLFALCALMLVCGFVWGGFFESMRTLDKYLDLYAKVVTRTHTMSDTGCCVSQSAVDLRPGETVTICGVADGVRTSCDVKTCLGDKETEKPPQKLVLSPGVGSRDITKEPLDTARAVLKVKCPICGKTYEHTVASYSVSCSVYHPPGSCCHYGQREVKP